MNSIVRNILLSVILLTASSVVALEAAAQTVTGVSGLDFGTIYRLSSSSISYNDNAAAQFKVEGKRRKKVRITVSVVNLTRSSNSLPITVTNSDCAYSTDDGSTWTTFSSGTLYQDLKMPKKTDDDEDDDKKTSTVFVRVGGAVTSGSTQQRGVYSGTVTVSVSYL